MDTIDEAVDADQRRRFRHLEHVAWMAECDRIAVDALNSGAECIIIPATNHHGKPLRTVPELRAAAHTVYARRPTPAPAIRRPSGHAPSTSPRKSRRKSTTRKSGTSPGREPDPDEHLACDGYGCSRPRRPGSLYCGEPCRAATKQRAYRQRQRSERPDATLERYYAEVRQAARTGALSALEAGELIVAPSKRVLEMLREVAA